MRDNTLFCPDSGKGITVISSAGYSDTSAPRLHAKGSGFLFEYVLSGELCIESPELLMRAGIGDLVIIHSSEECVLYKEKESVTALSLQISGLVLDAVYDVLGLPRVFCATSDLLDKFLGVGDLYTKYSSGDGDSGRMLLELALSLMFDALTLADRDLSPKKPSAERIKEYLDLCLCGDVNLDAVGKRFGITGMHVIRLFRAEYDLTPMQYLKICRLEKSAEFLRTTRMSIKDISSLLRFSSTQHFTNLFREHFGVSPGRFREVQSHS